MWDKLWEAIQKYGGLARDARIGAVGADQVRELYTSDKQEDKELAKELNDKYLAANAAGIAGGATAASALTAGVIPTLVSEVGGAVGSYAAGKAGSYLDEQFGTQWISPTLSVLGGLGGGIAGYKILKPSYNYLAKNGVIGYKDVPEGMLKLPTTKENPVLNVGWAPKQTINIKRAGDLDTMYYPERWDVTNEGANSFGVWLQGKFGIPRTDVTNPGKGAKAAAARKIFADRKQYTGEITLEKPMQTVGEIPNRSDLSYAAEKMGADGIIYNNVYDNGYNNNQVIFSFKKPSIEQGYKFYERPSKLSELEFKGVPKGERPSYYENLGKSKISPEETAGIPKGDRNNGRYNGIYFFRTLSEVPSIDPRGYVQIGNVHRPVVNTTTDQLVRTNAYYPSLKRNVIVINPEGLRGSRLASLDPSDTMILNDKSLKIKPKHITFISGDADAIAEATKRGFHVISTPKLKRWIDFDASKYQQELRGITNRYFSRPTIDVYKKISDNTGLPLLVQEFTGKNFPKNVAKGVNWTKQDFKHVVYDPGSTVEHQTWMNYGLDLDVEHTSKIPFQTYVQNGTWISDASGRVYMSKPKIRQRGQVSPYEPLEERQLYQQLKWMMRDLKSKYKPLKKQGGKLKFQSGGKIQKYQNPSGLITSKPRENQSWNDYVNAWYELYGVSKPLGHINDKHQYNVTTYYGTNADTMKMDNDIVRRILNYPPTYLSRFPESDTSVIQNELNKGAFIDWEFVNRPSVEDALNLVTDDYSNFQSQLGHKEEEYTYSPKSDDSELVKITAPNTDRAKYIFGQNISKNLINDIKVAAIERNQDPYDILAHILIEGGGSYNNAIRSHHYFNTHDVLQKQLPNKYMWQKFDKKSILKNLGIYQDDPNYKYTFDQIIKAGRKLNSERNKVLNNIIVPKSTADAVALHMQLHGRDFNPKQKGFTFGDGLYTPRKIVKHSYLDMIDDGIKSLKENMPDLFKNNVTNELKETK